MIIDQLIGYYQEYLKKNAKAILLTELFDNRIKALKRRIMAWTILYYMAHLIQSNSRKPEFSKICLPDDGGKKQKISRMKPDEEKIK